MSYLNNEAKSAYREELKQIGVPDQKLEPVLSFMDSVCSWAWNAGYSSREPAAQSPYGETR